MRVGNGFCQFSRMGGLVPQYLGFAHDTVLETGGSVRNLSYGAGVSLSR